MAREVVVDFNANIAKFTRSVNNAADRLGRFESQAARVGQSIKRSLGSLVVGFSIAQVVRATVDEIKELESTLSAVRAVTTATDNEMRALTASARALGATTVFSATEAARGMEFLGRAGFKTNQIIAAMPGLLDLAAAGALDLGVAADIASNVVSGFGLAAEEVTTVSDVLAKAAASSNTNVEQLGDAFKLVAPVASATGKSIEETAAAIGVLGNAGLQATRAGTGLRAILGALSAPSREAASAMERIGISLEQVNPQTRSFQEIFSALSPLTSDTAAAFQIFGREAAPAVLALVNNTDELSRFTDELKNAEGTAREMARVMSDNLTGDAKELGSALAELAQKIGDAGLTNVLRSATSGLTGLARSIGDLIDGPDLEELKERLDALQRGPTGGRSGRSTRARFIRETREAISDELSKLPGAEGIRNQIQVLEDELRSGRERIAELTDRIAEIPEERRRGRPGRSGRVTLFKNLTDELERTESDLNEKKESLGKLFKELEDIELDFTDRRVSDLTGDTGTGGGDDDRGRLSTAASDAEKFAESLNRLRDELDPAGKATRELRESVSLLDTAFFDGLINASEYDFLMQQLTTDTKAVANAQRELARDRDRALSLIGQLDPVSSLRNSILEIQSLRDKFMELNPAIADALGDLEFQLQQKMDEPLERSIGTIDKVKDAWQELGPTFSSALEDAIVSGSKFSDVLKGLEQDIIRLITRRVISKPIAEAVSGAFSGSGIFGDLLSSIFPGFANGGSFLVGGAGGIDSQVVAFRATPGERVEVKTPAQQGSQSVVNNFSFVLPTDSVDHRKSAQIVAREAARFIQLSQGAV